MSIIFRLASRRFDPSLLRNVPPPIFSFTRTQVVKRIPIQPPSTADYDEKNMKIGRPQSPHLTIYAPQLTSMLSITHRLTVTAVKNSSSTIGGPMTTAVNNKARPFHGPFVLGIALGGYTILFGLVCLYISDDPFDGYMDSLESSTLGRFACLFGKLIIALPLAYHYSNGIRHLLWDTGRFLSLKEVYFTGYVMVACAAAGAFFLLSL